MKKQLVLSTLLLLFLTPFCYGQKIVKKSYPTGIKGEKEASQYVFFIRYPKNYEKTKAKKGWQPTILLSTQFPLSSLATIQGGIDQTKKRPAFDKYIKLSEEYGLPIVSFNTPRVKKGYYSREGNDWELPKSIQAPHQKKFKMLAAKWKQCLETFCKEQGIQSGDFIGVGISNGAQWLSRFAMTYPEMFHSMLALLPGSNPSPSPKGQHIYWLHVSGGVDGGYPNCNRFYEKAVRMGYKRMYYLAPHDGGHKSQAHNPYQNKFSRIIS